MDIIYSISVIWFSSIVISALIGCIRGNFVEGFFLGLVFGPYGIYAAIREFPVSRVEKAVQRHIRRWWANLTWTRIAIALTCVGLWWVMNELRPWIETTSFRNFEILFRIGFLYGAIYTLYRPSVDSGLNYPSEPLCPECDYNLTGNVSGRCPECGTIVDSALVESNR